MFFSNGEKLYIEGHLSSHENSVLYMEVQVHPFFEGLFHWLYVLAAIFNSREGLKTSGPQ